MTLGLWCAVAQSREGKALDMNPEPSYYEGSDRLPVEEVSWDGITRQFLPALNALLLKAKISGTLRLPTEAEWEYTARGGRHWRDDYLFAGSDLLDEVGWYRDKSGERTHEMGQLYPNQLGIYDMSGNMWEWCEDAYDDGMYKK